MASFKWITSWIDGVRPDKSNIRNLFRDEVAGYQTLAELQAATTQSTRLVMVDGVPYLYDSADSSSVDNGVTVLVSADSKRYKLIPKLREKLTGARTYYVRTDGSNSNDGLANSSSRAFLTIQKAIDTVAALDTSIYLVTVSVADGTYNETVFLKDPVGAGNCVLVGNTTTPGNVIVSASIPIYGGSSRKWFVSGIRANGSSISFFAEKGGNLTIDGPVEVGAASAYHFNAQQQATIVVIGNVRVKGSAYAYVFSSALSNVSFGSITTTIDAGANYTHFMFCNGLSRIDYSTPTTSGTNSGTKGYVDTNSVVYSAGGGSNIPGSAAVTATGGLFL